MEHAEDKGNALAESNEADHNRDDRGEHADHFIQNAFQHICRDDRGEGAGSSGSLKHSSFPKNLWMRGADSNNGRKVQSLVCYLYTTPRND